MGAAAKFDPALSAAFLKMLESKDLRNLGHALQSTIVRSADEQALKVMVEP